MPSGLAAAPVSEHSDRHQIVGIDDKQNGSAAIDDDDDDDSDTDTPTRALRAAIEAHDSPRQVRSRLSPGDESLFRLVLQQNEQIRSLRRELREKTRIIADLLVGVDRCDDESAAPMPASDGAKETSSSQRTTAPALVPASRAAVDGGDVGSTEV